MLRYSFLIFEVNDIANANANIEEVLNRVNFDVFFNTRWELNEINSHASQTNLMLNFVNAFFRAFLSSARKFSYLRSSLSIDFYASIVFWKLFLAIQTSQRSMIADNTSNEKINTEIWYSNFLLMCQYKILK
jgi:hypothetical protein